MGIGTYAIMTLLYMCDAAYSWGSYIEQRYKDATPKQASKSWFTVEQEQYRLKRFFPWRAVY